MTISGIIEDGDGTSSLAKVTSRGELVTGRFDYSTAYAVTVNATATAFNFVGPIAGKRFVITDIILYANKNVGAADATVDVYEATASDSTTISKSILAIEMLKQTSRDLTGLNLIVTEGRWVNIKTDDDIIYATLMGYYVKA